MAIAGYIGWFVDEFRDIVKNAAIALLVVVIDKGLSSDDLDPPLSPEILTGDAALLLKINEFEHGSVLSIVLIFVVLTLGPNVNEITY